MASEFAAPEFRSDRAGLPITEEQGFDNQKTSSNTIVRVREAWSQCQSFLERERNSEGFWTGELSTSALSTATAVSALVLVRDRFCVAERDRVAVDDCIASGCAWLSRNQNEDGGFGDTDRSYSNIATTLLVVSAWKLANFDSPTQSDAAWKYVDSQGKWSGLRKRYGKDKTFVVPILANCALAGFVPWQDVPALPFEAAWLPQEWYRFARMPVVSYAVPALVAIGQARFHKLPPRNAVLRRVRRRALLPTLEVLRKMQPESGGYLEAVPLTSFVLMNLAAVGNGGLKVAQECVRFIIESRLDDGSWPIDTNLATWATSLTIQAMGQVGKVRVDVLGEGQQREEPKQKEPIREERIQEEPEQKGPKQTGPKQTGPKQTGPKQTGPHRANDLPKISGQTLRWLLSCQHLQRHPFTGATPGGWGWTNLSGAVPDADDTPSALLALGSLELDGTHHQRLRHEVHVAAHRGLRWLLKLQNRDGGWPTFCRGWGKLPFDRSGTDLTAHALRALAAWQHQLDDLAAASGSIIISQRMIATATQRGLNFLRRQQQADGSWQPLWFGNQDRGEEDNPCYGTGKVLLCYAALGLVDEPESERAIDFLRRSQNSDGGWGGGASVKAADSSQTATLGDRAWESSLEETAIALEALVQCGGDPTADAAILLGLEHVAERVRSGSLERAWPIGFYFAKLWYYERLYPAIFALGALGAALRRIEGQEMNGHEKNGLEIDRQAAPLDECDLDSRQGDLLCSETVLSRSG